MARAKIIAAVLAVAVCVPVALAQQSVRTTRKPKAAAEEQQPVALKEALEALDKRDFATAEPLLKEVLKGDPQNYQALFYLGYLYSSTDRRPEAIETYRKAITARPNVFETNMNLGMLLASEGSPEAAKYLKAAMQLKPSNKQDEALSRAWMSLGAVLEKTDHAGAVDAYQRAAELQPKSPTPHIELGHMLERSKDVAGAEKEFKQALVADPESADALASLANLYMSGKRFPEAEETIRAILKQQPGNVNAHLQFGRVLAAENKLDDAAKEFETTLQLAPTDMDALKELANVQMARKDYAAAGVSFQTLAAKYPNDAQVHYGYGTALMRANKNAEAQQQFMAAIKLKPEWGDAYGELAVAASANKDYNLAIRALNARAKFLAETPGTYFLRAVCFDHLGGVKEATEQYKQFLAVSNGKYPDQEWQARHRLIAIDPEQKKR